LQILIQIEGCGDDHVAAEAVPALYTPAVGGHMPETEIRTIITHWTAITGRDVKARQAPSRRNEQSRETYMWSRKHAGVEVAVLG
jgi:hypothetical protein